MPTITPQARYWLLTIPHYGFTPYLPRECAYIKGQIEQGAEFRCDEACDSFNEYGGGQLRGDCNCEQRERLGFIVRQRYLHWQVLVIFKKKIRLAGVKRVFGDYAHCEPSRSAAADEYVWKDDTSVEGTRFELGSKPTQRGSSVDWDAIRASAKRSALDEIPGDVYVRYYGNLKRIATDNMEPVAQQRTVRVYWGPTGTGKSRRAWDEAGTDAYPKDPRTKFWDGYRGHTRVVIDEFRGDIDIAHLLRWFDRYPVIVEVKGSSVVLRAEEIWITSNLEPDRWYPGLDAETRAALMRRLIVEEIN